MAWIKCLEAMKTSLPFQTITRALCQIIALESVRDILLMFYAYRLFIQEAETIFARC